MTKRVPLSEWDWQAELAAFGNRDLIIAAVEDDVIEAALELRGLCEAAATACRIRIVDAARAAAPGQPQADSRGVERLLMDPAVPIIAEAPLRASALLAEWLAANVADDRESLLLLPADAGVAHFAVAQRAQQIATSRSRIASYLRTLPPIAAVGREQMLKDIQLLELATTTQRSIERSDVLVLAPDVSAADLRDMQWELPDAISVDVGTVEGLARVFSTLASTVDSKTDATSDATSDARTVTTSAATTGTGPFVSVCVTHHDRPHLLLQTLASVERQKYSAYEVILVDDGSRTTAAHAILDELEPVFKQRGWTIVRQENRYLGAARNAAARAARGDWLLFIDDDDCMRDDYIHTFVHAAVSSGADIATCFLEYFEGNAEPTGSTRVHHRWVMPGPIGAGSLVVNSYGGANAIIRKELFHQLGGYTEDHGIGYEDWEFYNRAFTHGARFEVIPRPLLWCRWGIGGMQASATRHAAQQARAARPVREALPHAWQLLPDLVQGLAAQNRDLMAHIVQLESEKQKPNAASTPTGNVSVDATHTTGASTSSGPAAVAHDTHDMPSPIDPDSVPRSRVYVWHTDGLGLSGILSWMWRLRDQFAPLMNMDVRLVDLAALPYEFAQAGTDPSVFYDERITTSDEFVAFLRRTPEDVHIVNHAFNYLDALRDQLSDNVLARYRFVGVCHTDDDHYYRNLARLAPILCRIVAVSTVCAETLAKRIPGHAHKIVTLPAWAVGIPETVAPLPAPGEPLRLLYTGRVVQHQKRVFDLVELAGHLKRRKVNATLTIAGDGPDLTELKQQFRKRAGKTIPVYFEAVRPPWEMSDLLVAHHLLVQVSGFEGSSVSMMEALSFGLVPAVTATRSGHNLLRDGENAVIAPARNIDALAVRIATLAADPERLAQAARAARATAEQYLAELSYPQRFASLIHSIAETELALCAS